MRTKLISENTNNRGKVVKKKGAMQRRRMQRSFSCFFAALGGLLVRLNGPRNPLHRSRASGYIRPIRISVPFRRRAAIGTASSFLNLTVSFREQARGTRAHQCTLTSLLCAVALSVSEFRGHAQDSPGDAAPRTAAAPSSSASVGLLPIPDYSASVWKRKQLTGDWWGARTSLAKKGVQIGVELNQYIQGVTNGGRDRTAAYGGTADYILNLDLMRMGILPGALIRFRAESRFGSSVNRDAGPILPVNTDLLFPLSAKLDEDIPITVTNLNYTQFLSKYIGILFGKIDTLDGDPNEFASGRGTRQFMNANFIFNPAMALRFPTARWPPG